MKEEKKYLEGTRIEDLTGMKFGKLTVVDFDWDRYENDKIRKKNGEIISVRQYWFCKCECGNINSIESYKIKSGSTKTCGCRNTVNQKMRLLGGKSFQDWCIENKLVCLLDAWDADSNKLKPSDVPYRSTFKYWFKCKDCGDKILAKLDNIVAIKKIKMHKM